METITVLTRPGVERDTQMYLKRERDRNRERKNIKDNKIKMKKQKERRG